MIYSRQYKRDYPKTLMYYTTISPQLLEHHQCCYIAKIAKASVCIVNVPAGNELSVHIVLSLPLLTILIALSLSLTHATPYGGLRSKGSIGCPAGIATDPEQGWKVFTKRNGIGRGRDRRRLRR